MSAFSYLAQRTIHNWVRLQLGRLRTIRYLLALLAGGLYFWVFFFRNARAGTGSGMLSDPEVVSFAALVVAIPIAVLWLIRANPQALAFSDAERQHLFTAPLTRRGVILYKLSRGQLAVLLNVLIFAVILMREADVTTTIQRGLAFWVVFTTIYLHRLGAALTRLAGRDRRTRVALNVAPAVVIGAALTAIAFSVQKALPRILEAPGFDEMVAIALQTLSSGPAGFVLMPFRLLIGPIFAAAPAEWARAMGAGSLILVAHLVWVLRVNTAFEDAAAAAGARASSRAAGIAEGRPPPRSRFRLPRLPLRPRGRPEVAIVWKNTVPMLDAISPIMVIALVVLVAMVANGIANRLPASVSPGLLVMIAALVGAAAATALGPFAFRNDLRNDLPRLSLLRTYPLRGENLVWAEVLAVAIPIAAIQILLLVVAFFTSLGQAVITLGVGTRVAILLALVLVLPCIALTGLLVQNAAVLLFPDWVRIGPSRGGGIEATGQMMLLFGATLFVTLLLLVLPVVGGGIVAFVLARLGTWAMVPAALVASGLLLAQIFVMLRWLGGVFDRTDPVTAGLER